MEKNQAQQELKEGRVVLGIELGSTRIKSVLIGTDHTPLAEGAFTWENQLADGIWTYSLDTVREGLRHSYAACASEAEEKYGLKLQQVAAIGISAMMHGYLPLDENDELLVPFRTWRNTITKPAAEKLTELLHFNIPQRWSIAHLYQALLNKEEHVAKIRTLMTLAEYVHWKLTGEKVLGIGDASGMFPIDSETNDYDAGMLEKFRSLPEVQAMPWEITDLLPRVLCAGEEAGRLTGEGALFLDPSGNLKSGCPLCPPEGDAGTGMVATNAVRVRTGNVSAGTSDFAILVLEKNLSAVYTEIDMVTSPTGKPAANVHCNNCTTDLNAWVHLFQEAAGALGRPCSLDELYPLLYRKALEGEPDGGGLLTYNYYSGEGITDFDEGKPLFVRGPESRFTLANLMRTHLYSALATLAIGMEIITEREGLHFDRILAHGGLFKTKGVGQRILAGAFDTPITVMETAEQGGAWGIALLARYMIAGEGRSLEDWLDQEVFSSEEGETLQPDPVDAAGFKAFLERYKKGLAVERAAVENIPGGA